MAVSEGRILYVGGSGPGNYTRIQSAIDDALNGDTVFVCSGIYKESLYIAKSIRLKGENKYTTIVDGEGEGDIVLVTKRGRGTEISNLTLRNGGLGHNYSDDAAIEVQADNVRIMNNICSRVNYGVWVKEARNVTVINNTLTCLYDNIWLWKSKSCVLKENNMFESSIVLDGACLDDFLHQIENNTVNGKPAYYYKNKSGFTVPSNAGQVILVNCNNVTVTCLDISHATDAIEVMYSSGVNIFRNKLHGNIDFGIRLVRSNSVSIMENEIWNNPIGIGLMSGGLWMEVIPGNCYFNIIRNNIIRDNWYQGIRMDHSHFNTFTCNDFINNGWKSPQRSMHIYFTDSFENEWRGNYYDDWVGVKHPLFRELPKIIKGQRHLYRLAPDKSTLWLGFDWSPSSNPLNKL